MGRVAAEIVSEITHLTTAVVKEARPDRGIIVGPWRRSRGHVAASSTHASRGQRLPHSSHVQLSFCLPDS